MIISDKGTSFVGVENELKRILQEGKQVIEDFAVAHKLKWKFNTPLSPHQGGFFEADQESVTSHSGSTNSIVERNVNCVCRGRMYREQ